MDTSTVENASSANFALKNGVLGSSLPARYTQATAKIAHLGEVPARTRLLGCLLV
jgi:hypothetical protein